MMKRLFSAIRAKPLTGANLTTPDGRAVPRRPAYAVPAISYLHIGKTAGTQIGHVIGAINAVRGDGFIRAETHSVRLLDLPEDRPHFFSIRSPRTRFVSGFYSRLRNGQPRYNSPWSPCEAEAFSRFAHANDLAEALFEPGKTGLAAMAAIKSISHTSMQQIDWFCRWGFALHNRPPVWIIRQERFDEDLRALLGKLGVPDDITPSADPSKRHANDYSGTPRLSDKAINNLDRWYAQDLEFYRGCEDWLDRQTPSAEAK